MLVPLKWLNEYVKIDLPVDELVAKMTMTGSEVEGWEDQGEGIDKVVAGKIVKLTKHPDADKLQVCLMDVGLDAPIQIVTGAHNVAEGDIVPVALHGSSLPNGMKIKKGKLRGVESAGMLCSGEELALKEEDFPGAGAHGILILSPDITPGTDMKEVIGRDDVVVEFKTLANRPDCMSLLGIAREAAATLNERYNPPSVVLKGSGGIEREASVSVLAPDLCARYTARVVKNVRIAPSPEWMRKRLRAAGVRSINNIVDITNFVMLEMGQPLHAFDMRDLSQRRIVVRRAKPGEELITLDEKKRELSEDMLLICDSEGPVGLAGVMGGLNSEIKPDTTEILLESAHFSGSNIRATSRALGLRTEASARFEKGVDITATDLAVNRACQMIELLDAGDVVSDVIDICSADLSQREITVSPERVRKHLGMEIPTADMVKLLNRVFIQTVEREGMLLCKLPGYRLDIEGMADIAEEVLRLYGYDSIPETLMDGPLMRGRRNQAQRDTLRIRELLTGMGLSETVTYSFVSPKCFDYLLMGRDHPLRRAATLINPLGEDMSVMRTTIAHSLLETVAINLNRKQSEVSIFEIGKTYHPKQVPMTEQPDEKKTLGIALCAPDKDFYAIKGIVDALFAAFGIVAEYAPGGEGYLHPGRKALLTVKDARIGMLGEMHPDSLEKYGIGGRVHIAQIDIDMLLALAVHARTYRPLPRFPSVVRDIAVVLDEDQPVGPILSAISQAGAPLAESADVFDVYRGPQIGADKKSVAFTVSFRHPDRTLTEEEAAAQHEKIIGMLSEKFGGEIRK